MRKKCKLLFLSLIFNSFLSFTASKEGEIKRALLLTEHFERFLWKTFTCSKSNSHWFQDSLGFYFKITPKYCDRGSCSLRPSLCWTLRDPSDMISQPRVFCSKIAGENAINFFLPCFQEQTSLMLFLLRFFQDITFNSRLSCF